MKKTLYLGFCIVLVMGVGCAITDYQIITDNDQVLTQSYANVTVNTNGKAHIRSFQQAWIYPLGIFETLNFVDQKTNGDRTMTTYINWQPDSSVFPIYHDDLYCNPDWQGCSGWTASDPPGGYDRAGVGYAAFDGRWNQNCMGGRAGGAIGLLIGTVRGCRGTGSAGACEQLGIETEGECGRSTPDAQAKWMQLVGMGEWGSKGGLYGMFYHLNQNTATLKLDGVVLPLAEMEVWVDWQSRKMSIDGRNPLLATTLNAAGAVAGRGDIVDLELQYNGISLQKQMRLTKDPAANAISFF